MKRIFLWVLVVILILLSLDSPQGLIFPLGIVVYLFKDKFAVLLGKIPLPVAFMLSGLLFGLMTESFAILENLDAPPEQKILLHPNPAVDLFMGAFYYGMFILAWFLLLRKYSFSKKAVFIISGIFGLFTEQQGAVLDGIVANPLLGLIMAFLIMSVYGLFPLLAYMLTEERFNDRQKPTVRHYVFAALALFLFWAIYGNFVHKWLLIVFPK